MSTPDHEICCPGCLRSGQTRDPRRYCADCREDVAKQACTLCASPLVTDVPYVLCDDCYLDVEQYMRSDHPMTEQERRALCQGTVNSP